MYHIHDSNGSVIPGQEKNGLVIWKCIYVQSSREHWNEFEAICHFTLLLQSQTSHPCMYVCMYYVCMYVYIYIYIYIYIYGSFHRVFSFLCLTFTTIY